MKIVVCIKQVPDTTEVKIDPVKGTLIREGVPSIMNPDDKGGVELALRLKDSMGAQVCVLTMGPDQADRILREAFAMGVDAAYHLSDRRFAGADTLATSNALAGAIKTIGADLVITGRQAIDGDTAQVGPQIAEHLGLPQVSYVEQVEYREGGLLRVRKGTEEGYQILEVPLPCVLTAVVPVREARYMRVRGIMEAYDREVNLWNADNIDVSVEKLGLKGSPTKVQKSFAKGAKAMGQLYEVSAEEAANIIVEKLQEKFII